MCIRDRLGDTDQIDTPYLDSLSNGLTIIVEKLKNNELVGHITLLKGERSALATLASKVLWYICKEVNLSGNLHD
mgnify:CR=1 FL=1